MPRVCKRLTGEQKRDLWRRRRRGESIVDIERATGIKRGTAQSLFELHAGFLPPVRTRSPRVLSLAEREEISRGLAAGQSLRAIAAGLRRAPSTVSREVRRHGGARGYRATRADARAWQGARRPQACKLARSRELRELVTAKLLEDWSPQQISGWLAHTYPDDHALHVSTETIYRSLFVQARGVLKRELTAQLRTQRVIRHSRRATLKGQGRGSIIGAVSIRERPAEVEDRAVPGHWEGDLLIGAANTQVATLVERQTRFVMLVKVGGKDSTTVVDAVAAQIQSLPTQLRVTLTWDRGKELAAHRRFTLATEIAVYFCDPHSPWQRGTNENTNGLLRQYLPRTQRLSTFDQAELDAIAQRLNTRPRKTLDYQTPAAMLERLVAPTP